MWYLRDMVQRIDLAGEVFQILRDRNLMIDKTQGSVDDQSSWKETKQWMLQDWADVPPQWADDDVNIDDQPHGRGYPLLLPIQPIIGEGESEGSFRFPTEEEMGVPMIEKSIKEQGTDALAWYRPFHMDPPESWGITILDRGIWYVAWKLATEMAPFYARYSGDPGDQIQRCRDIAFDFLYHHEMFHFKVELAATIMEMNGSSEPIYARYWGPYQGGEWFGSQSEILRGNAPLEEALANSYARDKVVSELSGGEKEEASRAITKFMKTQPEGYKDASKVTGKTGHQKWKQGVSELIGKLLNEEEDHNFSPQRILAMHVLFDGVYGKEDWIEEYYAGIIPFRILDTGFAQGRFAARRLYLADFCISKTCHGEYKKAKPREVQGDFQKAIIEWEDDQFASTLGKRRPRNGFKLKGGWNKHRRVAEVKLKGGGVAWRVYHEKFGNGERILLRMHKKTEGKQDTIIDNLKKKRIDDWRIKDHHDDCDIV